jgi:hypothetical protein
VVPKPAIITLFNLPAHPLVVHAVVVVLPLAAFGGLLIAVSPSLRRRFGVAVLLLAAAGVGLVPLATQTGAELKSVLPPNNPLIEAHQQRGDDVLPYALAFGITVVLLVIAGRLSDREHGAAQAAITAAATAQTSTAQTSTTEGTGATAAPRTWRRIALVAAALVALSGAAVTVQVVRTGHSGSTAVWGGVGTPP